MPDHTAITAALDACTTPAEVDACADKYRADVMALANDPGTKVFALQIANLKAYRLWEMRNPK